MILYTRRTLSQEDYIMSANKQVVIVSLDSGFDPDLVNNKNILKGNILAPPPRIQWIYTDDCDGSLRPQFNAEYEDYLNSNECDKFIVAMLTRVVSFDGPVLLYIPYDDYECYGGLLIAHIYNKYGVPTTINPVEIDGSVVLEKLYWLFIGQYLYDYISFEKFIAEYHNLNEIMKQCGKCQTALMDVVPQLIYKMIADHETYPNITYREAYNYFNEYIRLGRDPQLKQVCVYVGDN